MLKYMGRLDKAFAFPGGAHGWLLAAASTIDHSHGGLLPVRLCRVSERRVHRFDSRHQQSSLPRATSTCS